MKLPPLVLLLVLTVTFGLFTSFIATAAPAEKTECFVKRVFGPRDALRIPVMADLSLGSTRIKFLKIASHGKTATLKIDHLRSLSGSTHTDQITKKTTYTFQPYITRHAQRPIQDAPINILLDSNWIDLRDSVTVVIDPKKPENSIIQIRYEERSRTDVLGIGVAHSAWKPQSTLSRPLVACETRIANEPSLRPAPCTQQELDAVPIGTRCSASANGAVFEKVVTPIGTSGWKTMDESIWSAPVGMYDTRAEAVKACRNLGASLPVRADVLNNNADQFNEAIGFSRYGSWINKNKGVDYKGYWMDDDYFFTYSDRAEWGNRGDAIFVVQKGFISGSISDSRGDFLPKPYPAICVWRK